MDNSVYRKILETTFNKASSPLLRLPPELRGDIFERVLCGNTIHISARRTQAGEDGGVQRHPGEPFIKPMHAVCLCSRQWSEAYGMSKALNGTLEHNFDDRGFLKLSSVDSPEILRSYYTEHRGCNSVLNDFNWQDYATFSPRDCRCPFPCAHYFEYRQQMIEKFGEAPKGLHVKHRASRYSVALLSTCRLIHRESALLPYCGNTFAFQTRLEMDLFLDQILTSVQRNAIQRVNICIRSLMNPTLPRTIPEHLKVLECFIVNDDGKFWQEIQPWRNRFEKVEVISGWDGRRSTSEDGRSVRREKADELEKFLEFSRSE